MTKGKEFISQLKLYSDYLKWDEGLGRYETWEEACDKVLNTHAVKYGDIVEPYLDEIRESYHNKEFLSSQRNLQFRGESIFKHNTKIYNCLSRDTEFITSNGVKNFYDFEAGDSTTVLSHTGKWRNATVKRYGYDKLYIIKFKKGESISTVRATSNHKWLLSNGESTTNLKVGDRILKPNSIFHEFDYDSATPFEKLYWCYGFVYGDGTITSTKYDKYSMVRLCGNDIRFESRFIENGFKSSSSLSLKGDIMIYTGKYNKTSPNPNVDSPELIRAFVSGYLQADGEKNNNPSGSDYKTIQSSEIDHIEFIRSCFPIAGVYMISEKNITGQETNYGTRPYSIKFKINDKMDSKYSSGYRVLSIEEDVNEYVWCLEVEIDKSFTLKNGIVTGNCTTAYGYSPDIFNRGFYVLLSGCGLGVSLKKKYYEQLPKLNKRTESAKSFTIEDSIEGWAEAIKVLISSYCEHPSLYPEYFGSQVKFEYGNIRPRGAYISGGFKAPGHEGLKLSIEKIEKLIDINLNGDKSIVFKGIIVYDILMHLSDAVLSGGVRRSAMNILIDEDDEELMKAKTGNWRAIEPQRARSNNSVGLMKGQFTEEKLNEFIAYNQGDNDIGFVFMNHEDEIFNPCFEVGFNFYENIKDKSESVFQFCNLSELNASACVDYKGNFSEAKFYELCRKSSIIGTLQAGYTSFPYLGKQTEDIVSGEALIGVSITGWMTRPELFNEEILLKGANIVKKTNSEVAMVIGINEAARTTTVKPSGNACLDFSSPIKTEFGDMTLKQIFEYCLDTNIIVESLMPKTFAKPIKPLKIYNENNELEDITNLYVNGLSDTYEIEFEDGIKYNFTGEHKLKTSDGWKRVDELIESDEIISF